MSAVEEYREYADGHPSVCLREAADAAIAELEAALAFSYDQRVVLLDHFNGQVTRAEQAEAALAERDDLIGALERGGIRIVSGDTAWTLREFMEQVRLARHDAEVKP